MNFDLPPKLKATLDEVRRRIRRLVWTEGVSKLVALVAIAFWLGLVVDWTFEPSADVRRTGLILLAAVVAIQAYSLILRRAFVRFSDRSIANLLERRFPDLEDHVATAVELTKEPLAADLHPEMVMQTLESAESAIEALHTGALFNRRPLIRVAALAGLLCLAIATFATVSPEAFGVWVRRIALSEQQWPRRVHLEVAGFPPTDDGQRVQKVAQDDDFSLEVHAMLTEGHVAPENVQLRFRLTDGRRGRDWLVRVGKADPATSPYQLFRYGFENVTTDMTFDVVGGDDQVQDLQLRVVPRPELVDAQIRCQYPDYLSRPESVTPVSGSMRFPTGSVLMLESHTSKPIVRVTIQSSVRDTEDQLDFTGAPQTDFRYSAGQFTEDDVLFVDLLDLDGVACREPYRIALSVIPDEPPQLAVRLQGISTVVTPDAVIPIEGKVSDDNGLDAIWVAYHVDEGRPEQRPSVPSADGAPEIRTVHRMDLRTRDAAGQRLVDLRPGQNLAVTLVAQDRYDLGESPQTASSQQFTLEVVTPEKLLALMERRELTLRQRFESLKEKLVETRDLLQRIDFAGATGGDESESSHAIGRRELRIVGAIQNVMQTTQEVLGIAAAFDDLHAELVNNRIDNDELKSRLKYDIAEPLHAVGEDRLPQLDKQLQSVRDVIDKPEEGQPRLDQAVQLCDQILVEIEQILRRMLELESYNEVVALLRDIITEQEQLHEKTKDRQREQLRNVLED